MVRWAIALHGGAGTISRDSVAPEMNQKIEDSLNNCLQAGISALQSSSSAMDAVEIVVRALENNPLFNAGRGSVFTSNETIEMEACIMDGATKKCGAVSGLTTVVNPISLARLVMEKTPYIYLGFDGAQEFAREQGVEFAEPEYFRTETRLQRLRVEKAKAKELESHEALQEKCGPSKSASDKVEGVAIFDEDFVGETVGCVAVDKHGNCAAATSTGGLTNKMVGRIGDTPIVGAGTYANGLCAVSATGIGEHIIRATVGRDVAAIMEFKGASLSEAVDEVVGRRVDKDTTGLVSVSSSGEIVMRFNTSGMYRAAANEGGHLEVGIWE